MASVTTLGVGSGIDVRSLVDGLVAAERDPKVARFDNSEADSRAGISALGTLSAAVDELNTALDGVADFSDFKRRAASSGDEASFTVSADGSAVSGNYDIEVVSLANHHKLSSDVYADDEKVGTGTLVIGVGDSSFTLSIDDSNNTLTGLQAAINADENNKGVTASIVTDDAGTKLILTANETGTANAISITATDDDAGDGNDLGLFNTAQLTPLGTLTDAEIKLDGLTITRSSNKIDDALAGVTLNLLKENEADESNSLSVSLDKDSIKEGVNKFVEAYNSFVSIANELSLYGGRGGGNGPLFGDSTLRTLESQLRRGLSSSVEEGVLSNLTQLGISTQADGSLTMDESKLDEAIEDDFTSVGSLLSGEKGIAGLMRETTRSYRGSTGIIEQRTTTLENNLDDIADGRLTLKERMENFEISLINRFITMDQLVSSMKSTGDFVISQLNSLNGNDDN